MFDACFHYQSSFIILYENVRVFLREARQKRLSGACYLNLTQAEVITFLIFRRAEPASTVVTGLTTALSIISFNILLQINITYNVVTQLCVVGGWA